MSDAFFDEEAEEDDFDDDDDDEDEDDDEEKASSNTRNPPRPQEWSPSGARLDSAESTTNAVTARRAASERARAAVGVRERRCVRALYEREIKHIVEKGMD